MELTDSGYYIQGIPARQIAETFGTPVYVYDAQIIERQVNNLRRAFEGINLKIKYAVKSLPNLSVLKLIRKLGCELDTVSVNEARLGLMAGFSPSQILFTPNSVSFAEVKEAVELGLTINIDNISILEQFGHTYGSSVPCCIRLNPHIAAGGNSKIQTGHIDSKFGISIYQLRHVVRVVQNNKMHITGLHVHTGSDILDAEVFLRGAQLIFEAASEFPDLQFLDFGSGFKVPYRAGDVVTDIQQLGNELKSAFYSFFEKYGRELEIWFEPGKYIVSESGVLLVRTNVLKTTTSAVFAGVDSGLNHLIRPMMYNAYHEIENVSNPFGAKRIYSVVGYICETDTFGWDRKISEIHEGDILAIRNAGAYGMSMASNYNSRLRPAEVLVYNGQPILVRERETFDDLLRHQIQIDF